MLYDLNDAEKKDLCKSVGTTPDDLVGKHVLHDAAFDMERFMAGNEYSVPTTSRHAKWFATVLNALAEDDLDPHLWKAPLRGTFTVTDVIEAVAAKAAEARRLQLEDWNDAGIPKDEFSTVYYPGCRIGDDGPLDHPWGTTQVLLQKWCAIRPYQVWKVEKACRDAGRDALEEEMLYMARGGEDGTGVGNAVQQAFEKAVERIKKELA